MTRTPSYRVNDRILGARHAIEQLVRLKGMAAESAGRTERCADNGWKSVSHLHDLAFRR